MTCKKTSNLWTKDFTCITLATVLSMIGGEAMNLPISLLVFDETKSTFLSALILICGMLPDILLPILVAPLIDRSPKKRWIVSLDLSLVFIYFLMGYWMLSHSFNYLLYMVFVLVVGTASVFYRLAYNAWYPDIIPHGEEQRGYAVSSSIYPAVIITMSPAAAFLYDRIDMSHLFMIVTAIGVLSILLELMVTENKKASSTSYSLQQYRTDLKEGFIYLREEKGIRNIYSYMSITNGASHGIILLTQVHFQTAPWLSVTLYGFLKSAEMIGRLLGGILQYTFQIPLKKRFAFTKFVYVFYDTMDAILLFLPYPLMVVNRFICGGLGASSATIREAAVKSYLPDHMRARISAFFNVVISIGSILTQLLAGLLGQFLSYRVTALLMALIPLVCVYFMIVQPVKDNQPIYEAQRQQYYSEI